MAIIVGFDPTDEGSIPSASANLQKVKGIRPVQP